MMHVTKKIADDLSLGQEDLLAVNLHLVTRYGTDEDAAYLLPLFLQTKDAQLLQPLQVCGSGAIADELFRQAIERGRLKEDFPPETLMALGYLQHAETEGVLMNYYQTLFDKKGDWQLHRAVCLALLNYSCRGYEELIGQEIEKCLNAWLFPELIPVLACKTGDPTLAAKMYHHGCTQASADSNAGLLLGLALSGADQKALFKKAMYNPDWEAGSTATGNRTYTMMGLSALSISIGEMFMDIVALAQEGGQHLPQHLFLLESMLEAKLQVRGQYLVRSVPLHAEEAEAVYKALFTPADDATVFTYIEQVTETVWKEMLQQSFNRLQELYAMQMAREAEREYLLAQNVSGPF